MPAIPSTDGPTESDSTNVKTNDNDDDRYHRLRTVTMRDIAQVSGVSQSTVSRVLNDTVTSVPIAAGTRQRVLDAAERLGYRPNPLARGLRGAKTMLLGLIVRDIADLFFTTAVEAVSLSARERNYNVVLGSADSRADEAIALRAVLETRHCDGIVLLGDVRDQPRLFADLAASHVPVVALWQGTALGNVATINIDNRGGIASAVDHLAGLGHRRFGFIGGYPHGDILERRAGFIERLTALGMPPLDAHVHAAENTLGSGAEAFRSLMGMADRPTAIVTATDQVAIGALHAAHALGVDVPGQVSIVGFDDIPLAQYTAPPLTTVSQPLGEMAELAVSLAIDSPAEGGVDHVFATTLSLRATTGPGPS
jgi:DNA-binding LacI/PurR family transcriptional regulator